MSKTMLNIKIDAKLKTEAQKFAKSVGLPLSAILNNYLRQLVIERRVVFEERLVPNKKTAKILDKAISDIKEGKNLSPDFSSADEAIAWLNE